MGKQGFSVYYKNCVSFQSLKRGPVMAVIASVNPKQPKFNTVVDFDKRLGYLGLFIIPYNILS
jgi:hypothetical protein